MAKIISKIGGICFNIFYGFKRGCESTGQLALHPDIVQEYKDQGFDSLPRTFEEMKRKNASSFNGLAVSLVSLRVYPVFDELGEKNLVAGELFPMRYAFTTAVQNLLKSGKMSLTEAEKHNPQMLNVSLLAVVKIGIKYYLLSQRKGKGALGEGQLHASLTAGRVDAELLRKKYFLNVALKGHIERGVGADIKNLPMTPQIMVNEPDVGMVNFAFTARVEEETIISAYKKIAAASDTPKIAGLSLLPISDVPEIFSDGGKMRIKALSFTGDLADQIEELIEIRPYTKAIIDFIREGNFSYLTKTAGF